MGGRQGADPGGVLGSGPAAGHPTGSNAVLQTLAACLRGDEGALLGCSLPQLQRCALVQLQWVGQIDWRRGCPPSFPPGALRICCSSSVNHASMCGDMDRTKTEAPGTGVRASADALRGSVCQER